MAYTAINKSSLHMNTKLYAGNGTAIGSGGNAQTGVGFQPDLVWIKDRSATNHHNLFDAVRGVTKGLQSSQNNAEYTNTETVTAFGTDGFTVGDAGGVNTNSNNYVAWNWKAGTTGSGNTTGSGTAKTYNYSVNTTAGFSIINYVGNGTIGQQIPHHLGVTPQLIIQKNRDRTSNFLTYHHNNFSSNGDKLNLNSTDATATDTGTYNSAPTSTHVVIGNDAGMNTSDENHIMYCFAEKTGYNKVGFYTGNGNDGGPFIYTGFSPTFLLLKETSSGTNDSWFILDNKRITYNPRSKNLRPNSNDAEADSAWMIVDFLSNGFKINDDDASINESGKNYIYMAFGQTIVGTNNIPATAR